MKNNDLKELWRHISTINEEMGVVQTDLRWVKSILKHTAKKSDLIMMKWGIGLLVTLVVGLILAMVSKVI